jgi:hypothetical protein
MLSGIKVKRELAPFGLLTLCDFLGLTYLLTGGWL